MSTYINYHAVPDLTLSYVQGQCLLAQECSEEESFAEPDCHWPMMARDLTQTRLVLVAWTEGTTKYRAYWVAQCYAENAPAYLMEDRS